MACLADMRRLATVGSRWRLEGNGPPWRPLRCGICTVTRVAGDLPRYRVVFDDGGTARDVRLDLPSAEYLRFHHDTAYDLADPTDPASWVHSWRYLGHMTGPVHQPPADPATVRWCRVDRLHPGDIVYGTQSTYTDRAPGYTIEHVDLTGSPAAIFTREGWPLRHAPWTLLATVPADDPDRCQDRPVLAPVTDTPTTVYLGVNTVAWLARPDLADIPKCISRNRLAAYRGRRLPRTLAPLLLDSGGFTELKTHGRWRQTAADYLVEVRAILAELGPDRVVAIAPQDWMCEDEVINGGRTKDGVFVGTRQLLDPQHRLTLDEMVHEHQRLTTDNFVQLRLLAPDLPIFPVLQGKTKGQYIRHTGMYLAAGVGFNDEPVVGLGSVCRRQGTQEVAEIVRALAGIRLHGFGVGLEGLSRYGHLLVSVDSNAWSYHGRRGVGRCPHGVVTWETKCSINARTWWENAHARLSRRSLVFSANCSTSSPRRT